VQQYLWHSENSSPIASQGSNDHPDQITQKFQDVLMGFSPYGGQARSSHYHLYRLLLVADK
jgi:hypothetical protein